MGCCASSDERDILGEKRDKEIDDQIRKDRQQLSNEVKLLLLGKQLIFLVYIFWKLILNVIILDIGAGESGKSTLLKQMRIIHEGSFPESERKSYREIVFNNVIDSMKSIIGAMNGKLKIQLSDEENRPAFELIDSLPEQTDFDQHLSKELSEAIKLCWQDEGVQEAYNRRNEYQLNDSAA